MKIDIHQVRDSYAKVLKEFSKYLEDIRYIEPFPFLVGNPPRVYLPLSNKRVEPQMQRKERIESSHSEVKITLNENQICQLCSNKAYAVRKYFKKPTKEELKIMILHYNGSIDNNQIPKDVSEKFYFSSKEEDEVFNRMLSSFHYTLENFYFQEFVACHFSFQSSHEEWNTRVQNCLPFLEKNVKDHQIQKLMIVGSAAILLFGNEAKEIVKKPHLLPFHIHDLELKAIILRSPQAILKLEQKRKELQSLLQKYPKEWEVYNKTKEIDQALKEIVESLQRKEQTKRVEIANVKLTPASQIKNEKTIENEIKKQLGESKLLLYKTFKAKKEEIEVKQQIVKSLEVFFQSQS
ncbi:MAG: hypothetical protein NZ853_01500 [Leptospiraceae bacterium]|nr:hypothetical protein [Leptospiraceae bacterium]MDW7976097.1 hypothetical protein [Leptospiraceae bacterium]